MTHRWAIVAYCFVLKMCVVNLTQPNSLVVEPQSQLGVGTNWTHFISSEFYSRIDSHEVGL